MGLPWRATSGGQVIKLHLGDCLELLKGIPDDSIDAVVTDPPYGLSAPPDIAVVLQAWLAGEAYEHTGTGFMGAAWDSFVPGPRVWREVFRVLKPGGHAVVFAGTRTVDLMGISVRLGGFEVRDMGAWTYWSGFPKSLDLSKAMDRLAGAEREDTGVVSSVTGARNGKWSAGAGLSGQGVTVNQITAPATDNARKWAGFGTAVKPAVEPWLLLRKPISESSIARNVLAWGVGGLNVDACRFAPGDSMWPGPQEEIAGDNDRANGAPRRTDNTKYGAANALINPASPLGRFPANLIHCPKASRKERELGCEGLPTKTGAEAVKRTDGSGLQLAQHREACQAHPVASEAGDSTGWRGVRSVHG